MGLWKDEALSTLEFVSRVSDPIDFDFDSFIFIYLYPLFINFIFYLIIPSLSCFLKLPYPSNVYLVPPIHQHPSQHLPSNHKSVPILFPLPFLVHLRQLLPRHLHRHCVHQFTVMQFKWRISTHVVQLWIPQFLLLRDLGVQIDKALLIMAVPF